MPAQLAELNSKGSITLDLAEAIPHFDYEENRRLNDINVIDMRAKNSDGRRADQPIRITFDHWGASKFRRNGRSYVFEHRRTSDDRPFQWGGLYDTNSPHNWSRQSVSPTYVQTLQTLLNLGNQGKGLVNLFVHPGLDCLITIQRQSGDGEEITNLTFNVDYDYDRGTMLEYPLKIVAAQGGSPLITVSPADDSGRSLGEGTFTRMYSRGTQVTLVAPANFGQLHFKAWHIGGNINRTSTVTVRMDQPRTVSLEYGN